VFASDRQALLLVFFIFDFKSNTLTINLYLSLTWFLTQRNTNDGFKVFAGLMNPNRIVIEGYAGFFFESA